MNNNKALRLEDYPEMVKVFEDAGYEAVIEQRPGTGDKQVLRYREKAGLSGWNTYPLDQMAEIAANSPERIDDFIQHLWHQIGIYPKPPRSVPAGVNYAVWLPIREKLPEADQDVLVYGETYRSNGPEILVAHYRQNDGDMYAERFSIYDHGTHSRRQLYSVSHWAHLLPPPTE